MTTNNTARYTIKTSTSEEGETNLAAAKRIATRRVKNRAADWATVRDAEGTILEVFRENGKVRTVNHRAPEPNALEKLQRSARKSAAAI